MSYCLFGLFVCIVALFFIVHTAPVRRYVLGKAAEALRARGILLTADTLNYDLPSLSGSLEGVVIQSASATDLPPIFSADTVAFRVRWAGLFAGSVVLEEIALQAPDLQLVWAADGRSNIPELPASAETPPSGQGGLAVAVLHAVAREGSLAIEDRRRNVTVSLPEWETELRERRIEDPYELEFVAEGNSFLRWAEREVPIDGLEADASYDGQIITFERLQLQAPHTQFVAEGGIGSPGNLNLDLDIQVNANVARWVEMMDISQPFSGTLDAELTAMGAPSQVSIAGAVRSENFSYRARSVGFDARIAWGVTTNRLVLDPLEVRAFSGLARGRAAIALTNEGETSGVALTANRLDTLSLMRFLNLPVQVASRVDGTFRANWPGLTFGEADWEGEATLASMETAEAGVLPLSGSVAVAGREGRIRIELQPAEALGAAARGEVTLGPGDRLAGELSADIPRLNHTATALATYLDSAPVNFAVEGAAQMTVTLDGTLDAPGLVASASTSVLHIGGLPRPIQPLDAVVSFRDRELAIDARAPAYAAAVTARMNVSDPYPAEVSLQLAGTDLAELPVTLPDTLTGVIALDAQAQGNLGEWRNAEASVRIDQLDVTWNDRSVGLDQPLRLDYRDNGLDVQASFLAADSFVRLEGTLPSVPGSTGDLQVQSQWSLRTLVAFLGLGTTEVDGQLTVNGEVQGNLQRIDPSLDFSVTVSQLSDERLRSPLTDLAFEARLQGAVLDVANFSAGWAGGTVEATGNVPLRWFTERLPPQLPRAEGPAVFDIRAEGLQLPLVPGFPQEAAGTITLQANAEAPTAALEDVSAEATIEHFDVSFGGFRFQQTAPGRMTLENGTAQIVTFELEGPESRLAVSGSAVLREPRRLDVHVITNTNAAILSGFVQRLQAQGTLSADLAVTGPFTDPQITGFLETANMSLGVPVPPVAAQDLNFRLEFAGGRVNINRFSGTLNGGPMSMSGGLNYSGLAIESADVTVQAEDVFLRYPEGLQTLSDLNMRLHSEEDEGLLLSGVVTLVDGSYQRNLSLEGDLLPYVLGRDEAFVPTAERNAFLDRLRFNVEIQSASPIGIRNNLGQMALSADLRLLGSYYDPGLTGRMTLEEGGQLRLNERTYSVERGIISFNNQQEIEPDPDILARTQASGYDISVHITRQAGDIRTTLTSEPPLPEPDIISVLLTGRTLQEARGQELNVAGQQALSYIAGRLGQTFSTQVQQGLGLTTVRLEPSLISAESEPGARLTVAQDITPDLTLSYSMNVADSSDQIWAAQYDITPRFLTRAIRQSDNSYRFELRHRLNFGLPPALSVPTMPPERRVIGNVDFTGNLLFSRERLIDRLGFRPGDEYNFFQVQRGIDRLENLYLDDGRLESRVRTHREFRDSAVDLTFDIEAGPRIEFAFGGWDVPRGVRNRVEEIWEEGVFEAQRLEDATHALQTALVERGYLESGVTPEQTEAVDSQIKQVYFQIELGPRFRNVELTFPGAEQIRPSRLRELLEGQELLTDVYLRPSNATNLLAAYYREQGYLAAEVAMPRYELNSARGTGTVAIAINEGPRYRVGGMAFSGNAVLADEELRVAVGLEPGTVYLPRIRGEIEDRVREPYLQRGYAQVRVSSSVSRDDAAGTVALNVAVTEGQQQVVQQIQIRGRQETSEDLVQKQIAFMPGDLLTPEALGQARSRLYATGAFSLVDLEVAELPDESTTPAGQQPVRLNVNLREVPPWDLTYGGFYDTDRGVGVIGDLANHNMLGGARKIGLRGRYDGDRQEARIYFVQPPARRFFPRTDLAGYYTRDLRDAFITQQVGFSFQQGTSFGDRYALTYGYRLERTRTTAADPTAAALNTVQRIAPLSASVTRETRDDLLDASRGSFLSGALEVATKYAGSEAQFARFVVQYFKYVPLRESEYVSFLETPEKPRFVWASGIRLGLAGAFGSQELNPSQRFFAGGGTTIRGFRQDQVGPKDAAGNPLGGNSVFILNQELRFPLFSIFDGVGFLDVGNVYSRAADFNPFDVRGSVGAGLRVRTPYFMIRADYGVKLDRQPGESAGAWFFSIGQAF